jgi:hypothetical protein
MKSEIKMSHFNVPHYLQFMDELYFLLNDSGIEYNPSVTVMINENRSSRFVYVSFD